jgi:hypothetical protein
MTKLTVAVLRLIDRGIDLFRAVPNLRLGFEVEPVYFNRAFYSVLIYYDQAESLRANDDMCGQALGFYREATTRLNELCNAPFTPGKPSLFAKFSTSTPVRVGVPYLRDLIKANEATADRDNRLIYFHAVPSLGDLPPLPDGAYLMVCKKYIPPADSNLYCFSPHQPPLPPPPPKSTPQAPQAPQQTGTGLETLWSALTLQPASASAPPPPAAPAYMPGPPTNNGSSSGSFSTALSSAGGNFPAPSAPPSDYELAVQLQARIDAGENL